MAQRDARGHQPMGTCVACGKKTYSSRKNARAAARQFHPGDRMRAYPCPGGQDGYHIGHTPDLQRQRGVDLRASSSHNRLRGPR